MRKVFLEKQNEESEDENPGEDNPCIFQNDDVIIDLSFLYASSGNDRNFIFSMVQTFLKNMPLTIKKLEQSLNNQDWENVYKTAHSAKSSFSVIKVDEMLDWVRQVEENALNKMNLEYIPDLVKNINQKFLFAEKILRKNFQEKDSF